MAAAVAKGAAKVAAVIAVVVAVVAVEAVEAVEEVVLIEVVIIVVIVVEVGGEGRLDAMPRSERTITQAYQLTNVVRKRVRGTLMS